ncbi:MAG TPA: hypothetical protein DCY42_02675 [Chloroflexi bacterium]|nr:hypothetical protein [Chloroflexota bacterium]
MFKRITTTYQRFSPKFWILVLSAFIDRLGGTMIFPFFSLYITQKFDVGMTQAGVLLGSFSFFGFIGSIIGGALTDKFGRKGIVLFGLVFSACSSIAFGLVREFSVFFTLAVFVGLLSDVAGPAHQAMVADLLPEERRAEGYSFMRMAGNLAWILGPTIGGFLAGYSYMIVFVIDAITSLIVAGIVFRFIPETKPEVESAEEPESIFKTILGYAEVFKDRLYLAIVVCLIFSTLAYGQIYSTLSVFLRDVHGLPESGYGSLMSINASLVVLFQFWITSRMRERPPILVLALGTSFYLVGLTMYGYVSGYALFLAAMVLITIGEMVLLPTAQGIVANFAPQKLRGRYMAFFGLSWVLPSIFGPGLAGLILDGPNPEWLWFACGISCALAIAGFLVLHSRAGARLEQRVDETTR